MDDIQSEVLELEVSSQPFVTIFVLYLSLFIKRSKVAGFDDNLHRMRQNGISIFGRQLQRSFSPKYLNSHGPFGYCSCILLLNNYKMIGRHLLLRFAVAFIRTESLSSFFKVVFRNIQICFMYHPEKSKSLSNLSTRKDVNIT